MVISPEVERKASVLLSEARDELTRADQKAATLFGVVGVIFGLIAGAMIGDDYGNSATQEWTMGFGLACLVGTLLILSYALVPRTGPKNRASNDGYYFRDFENRTNADAAERIRLTMLGSQDRTLDQLTAISGIVCKKYRAIKIATLGACLSSTVCAIGIAVQW